MLLIYDGAIRKYQGDDIEADEDVDTHDTCEDDTYAYEDSLDLPKVLTAMSKAWSTQMQQGGTFQV